MQVDRIENTIFSSNTYIVSVEEVDFLVDCGDIYKLKDSLNIKAVFITHPHFDHIYGLNGLMRRFPNCTIYVHEEAYKALYNERLNLSKYCGKDFVFFFRSVVQLCKEISIIDINGFKIEAFHTPGHHPGAVCYRIGDYLFSGDSYIHGIQTITNLPQSDKAKAMTSEILIKKLWTKNIVLCPGHGNKCFIRK